LIRFIFNKTDEVKCSYFNWADLHPLEQTSMDV